jgi:(1->4)-alpha-D-glucan 1-alpha-D-glucosylmutase
VAGLDPTTMRVPVATYRLQFNADFTLADAVDVVGHLAALGVSDVYASPILTATRGAAHGYHTTDPTTVNAELGGDDALDRLGSALRAAGMGFLLDIVPNHLAASTENPWWADVLTHGRDSRYAHFFDIDWEAGDGRVVLPILGAPVDEVLARGELTVVSGDAGAADAEDTEGSEKAEDEPAVLVYYDTRLPLAPGTDVDQPVADVLAAQHYRLEFWRTGAAQMNYRRFFDITDLVGLRVEDPEVFAAKHERLRELVADGVVTGFRVDHVDGLRDPGAYLADLQRLACDALPGRRSEDEDGDVEDRSFYVVVEKIVEGDEPLPESWPVAGTTGYEFLTAVERVQIDAAGLERLGAYYGSVTEDGRSVATILRERKRAAVEELFAGEVDGLARRLKELAGALGHAVDDGALRGALVDLTVAFPVYRSYVHDGALEDRDLPYLDAAFRSFGRAEDLGPEMAFLGDVMRLRFPDDLDDEVRRDWLDVVVRWQQLTGPAMAKGFEDTTFYVHNRLTSLNEVGMDAHGIERPGGDIGAFHDAVARRGRNWPAAMNTTGTHDTKRSEDTRARLNVLSEVPEEWHAAVRRWSDMAMSFTRQVGDHTAPDPNEEWLLYQTLVGVWPLERGGNDGLVDRIRGFMQKAGREAKTHTSWLEVNAEHEDAVADYVGAVLSDDALVADLREFVERIAVAGAVNSLAQVVWKVAAPGVPDFYQGSEGWQFALVDPDNRRPVPWDWHAGRLDALREREESGVRGFAAELLDDWRDGRVKLWVTYRTLQARRRESALFLRGRYRPMMSTGAHRTCVVAFARELEGRRAIAVAPRTPTKLHGVLSGAWPVGDMWGDTAIVLPEAGRYLDVLTGRHIEGGADLRLADVLRDLPVALLVTLDG